MKVEKLNKVLSLLCSSGFLLLATTVSYAQDSTNNFKTKSHLYGLMFGDYFYKAHADSIERGTNQYAGMPSGRNAFQFRRIYIGYRYDISKIFTTDVLVESKEQINVSGNKNLSLYIKYANLRWKNIFSGSDLIIGQMKTPTFSTLTDKVWGYRAVEKTIADMHGSPSYDLGIALQGRFDAQKKFGYTLMAGNGKGASVEDNKYKKFYGEFFAKLADKRLIFDLYADYERLQWSSGLHRSQNMLKFLAAYSVPEFTIGIESFIQNLQNDLIRTQATKKDTLHSQAFGFSAFVRGELVKDKLNFFARLDHFNPYLDYDPSGNYNYSSFLSQYEPNNKNLFITAGFDYAPVKQVHFMPNIWYSTYRSQNRNTSGKLGHDYDLVYRLTFYFVYK